MTAANTTIYSIDASFLINLQVGYSMDVVPKIWEELDNLFESGKAYIIGEVYDEILKENDEIAKWVSERKNKIVKNLSQEAYYLAKEIMSHPEHQKLVDLKSTRAASAADPFLIAEASISGARIVTHEVKMTVQSNSRKTKLPNVCEALGVSCIHTIPGQSVFMDLARELSWKL
jgi:predicted nucleic acid-binding protein